MLESKQRIRVIPELAVCLRVRSGSEVEWWAHNPTGRRIEACLSKTAFAHVALYHALLLLLVSLLLHQYWHPELPC